MAIATPSAETAVPKAALWTGRVLTALTILFMLFDAYGKFTKPVYVADAFTRLGIPIAESTAIGTILLLCTILYAIPRTSALGAVLLTGYLGGAVAIHMRAGSTTFEIVFPVILGILAWAGLYLRDRALHRLLPIRM